MLLLFSEHTQDGNHSRDPVSHASGSAPSPHQKAGGKEHREMADKFKRMEASGGTEDLLLAVDLSHNTRAVWILQHNLWIKQGNVPTDFPEKGVCFCAVSGGLVGMGGEISYHRKSAKCYHFSISTCQWRKLPDMITPRTDASAAEFQAMVVMVVGGRESKDHDSSVCEMLDVRTGQWSTIASLPEPFILPLVSAANGKVFILKHLDGQPCHQQLWQQNAPEPEPGFCLIQYDPVSDTHTKKCPLLVNAIDYMAYDTVAKGDKVYLLGKIDAEYNCRSNQWRVLHIESGTVSYTNLTGNDIKYFCTSLSATVRGENILLCGGHTSCDTIVEYNPATRRKELWDIRLPFPFSYVRSYVANLRV